MKKVIALPAAVLMAGGMIFSMAAPAFADDLAHVADETATTQVVEAPVAVVPEAIAPEAPAAAPEAPSTAPEFVKYEAYQEWWAPRPSTVQEPFKAQQTTKQLKCDGIKQSDFYWITTPEMDAAYKALISGGVLNSAAEDAPFSPHNWTVTDLPKCETPPANLCPTSGGVWEISWGHTYSDRNAAPTFTTASNGGMTQLNGAALPGYMTTYNAAHPTAQWHWLYPSPAQIANSASLTWTYVFADGVTRTSTTTADTNGCPSVVWTEKAPVVVPTKPADTVKVAVVNGEPNCDTKTFPIVTTTTTTKYTLVENVWVASEPVSVDVITSGVATDEQCPVVVVPPIEPPVVVPPVVTPPVVTPPVAAAPVVQLVDHLAFTGSNIDYTPYIWMISVGLLGGSALLIWAYVGRRKAARE